MFFVVHRQPGNPTGNSRPRTVIRDRVSIRSAREQTSSGPSDADGAAETPRGMKKLFGKELLMTAIKEIRGEGVGSTLTSESPRRTVRVGCLSFDCCTPRDRVSAASGSMTHQCAWCRSEFSHSSSDPGDCTCAQIFTHSGCTEGQIRPSDDPGWLYVLSFRR